MKGISMPNFSMDDLDRRLLRELQRDADQTSAELAERVGSSASTCLRRVAQLKEAGVIRRVVAVVDPEALDRPLAAFVEVTLTRHGREPSRRLIEAARGEPAVRQLHVIAGEGDVMLMLQLRDMKEFRGVCERLFYADPNVDRFRTLFSMENMKDETAIPV